MGVGKSTVCRSFWCFSGINGCSYALCEYLECNVGDIMSFEKNNTPDIFDGGKSNG